MASVSPRSLHRRFITPEGVDLRLELGGAGSRAAAFGLDLVLQLVALIAVTIALFELIPGGAEREAIGIVWLLGSFALRNGWWIGWEMSGRGATPGKRLAGLRVVARDGGRLTGGAVVARNAMREVEVFLPVSMIAAELVAGDADAVVALFSLGWSLIFLLFPLFNRDRLRLGDIVAGTWVVRDVRERLAADLGAPAAGRRFSRAALSLYGEYELQTLADVLRGGQADTLTTVAAAIRRKAGLADDGDDRAFLSDYYAQLCAHLERRLSLGRRVADKAAAGGLIVPRAGGGGGPP